jgi:hypothetical protein
VDLLTWLLLVFGLGFAICLQLLVKTIGDLSQGSVYKAPAILETPGKTASAEGPDAKAVASYESSLTELSDAQSVQGQHEAILAVRLDFGSAGRGGILAVEIYEAVQPRPAAASRLRIRSRLASISSRAFLTCSLTSWPRRLTTSPPTITISTSAGPAPRTIVAILSP